MNHYTILTYKDIDELRLIQSETEVHRFEFVSTGNLLADTPNVCIDITSLLYYLEAKKTDIYAAYNNFANISEETIIIANADIADKGVELLPLLFKNTQTYHQTDVSEDADEMAGWEFKRKIVYYYKDKSDLERILTYLKTNNIPVATLSQAANELKNVIDSFSRHDKLFIIDLTSVTLSIRGDKKIIYLIEQLFSSFPKATFIAEKAVVDDLLDFFPLYIEESEPIKSLLPDLELEEGQDDIESIRKITDLNPTELDDFFNNFSHNLIGHEFFKRNVEEAIRNFIFLNKIGKQKVLSIFLFGESGIGKTEVARLFADGLHKDGYFTKISFQNYSSQDALNSLIGSPAGYIGCENGELSTKLSKSKIGIVLCDEFEKTTYPVSVFFLELLEEGCFTDSMSREYDLNGYIIVFTSNIVSENDYKTKIPAELRTRFDLVCDFTRPTKNEIKKYIDLLIEKVKTENDEYFSMLNKSDVSVLTSYDYDSVGSFREIKKKFYSLFSELIASKETKKLE